MTKQADEGLRYLQDFANASEEDQRAMMFDGLMNLLGEAVADNDIDMVKAYARIVTEMWAEFEGEWND